MCNEDLLKLIEKPWLSVEDIKRICECGASSARKIVKDIENQVISSGKNLPPTKKKLVPTNLVLDYLNIDVEYLRKSKEVASRDKDLIDIVAIDKYGYDRNAYDNIRIPNPVNYQNKTLVEMKSKEKTGD